MVAVLSNQAEDKADQVVVNIGDPRVEEGVETFVQEAVVTEDQIVLAIEMEVQKEGLDQIGQEDTEDVNSIIL